MQKDAAPPKVCPNCSGYGLLFGTMHYPAEPEKPALYYPERQVATVSAETLLLWRENCKKEIGVLEGRIKEFLAGIKQTTAELSRRELPTKVAQ